MKRVHSGLLFCPGGEGLKKRILMTVLVMGLSMCMADVPEAYAAEATDTGKSVEQSLDDETFSELMNFVKEKWDSDELESESGIRKVIEEGEAEFDTDIPKSAEDMIVKAVKTMKALGMDSDMLTKKAKELYDTYGDAFVENAEEVLTQEMKEAGSAISEAFKEQIMEPAKDAAAETVKATAKNFLSDLKNSVVNFVKNIFHI